jgi:hypothetical protein
LRLAVKFNKNVIKEILDFQKSLAGLVGWFCWHKDVEICVYETVVFNYIAYSNVWTCTRMDQ